MALSPDNPALSGQPGAQPDGQAPVEGQQPTPDGSTPPAPQTVEEVNAIWQNRFSQRDRAHNAEVESLRRQVSDLRGSAPPPTQADGSPAPTDSYKARYEATQRELEEYKVQAVVGNRRAQFPALAAEVSATDPVWHSANEESLARMNALISSRTQAPPPPTGPIDANQPPRNTPGPAKPLDQMSKDELLAELARQSPAEEARWRELQGG